MKRKVFVMFITFMLLSIIPAYATPPSTPHIESGSAADGGNYFEFDASYLGESGWRDLKTPPHWVVETGEIAYCLEHMADSPHGESYGKFDPAAIYAEETYIGLLAIIEHSFPYRNAGLTDKQIRYATSNAIRAWLRESAGIGYDFMLPSNNAVRPKTAEYQSAFNFYEQLLDKARNGSVINHTLTTNPSTIELQVEGNKLVGQTTIEYSALNGKYQINIEKFPSGTDITGYTGNNGDVLRFELPLSMMGETINITKAFTGYDNRSAVNVFWLDGNSGFQAVVVPIVDQMNPVTTANITIKSTPATTVTIIKHGKTNDTFLEGAVIEIYKAEDNTLVDTLTTDAAGTVTSNNLDIGDYYAKEITAPIGYALDDTEHPFSITIDNTEVELDLYNYPIMGHVGVIKGAGWKLLKDAVIGVYSIDGILVEELITNIRGSAISGPLEYGQYYIKEITAPPGYVKSDAELPFTIVIANRTIWLGLDNELITGRVQIYKVGENNDPLQGAVFKIFDDYANTIDEIVTNENGIAISKILDYGEYEIVESKAPIGFNMNMAAVIVNIQNQDEIVEITISNKPIKGKVQILKTSEEGIPLQGAIFGVYDSTDSLVYELTTDENGISLSKNLVYGNYYLKEITPPVGYNLNEDIIPFSIIDQGQTIRLTASNIKICGRVQILKTGETTNPLQGAVYEIFDISGTLIEELITDENGIAISNEIVYGEYYLKELTPPIGYNLNEMPIPFEIREQGITIEITAGNTRIRGKVRIIKVGEVDNPLQGTVFGVYSISDTLIEEFTTDENGIAESCALVFGDYYIKEIMPSAGYVLDNEKHPVSIQNNEETITLNLSNNWIRGQVEALKTDTETGQALEGAVFGIYSSDELMEEITTDNNGYAISNPIIYGEYYIKENKPPNGYTINKDEYHFNINQDKQVIHFDIQNLIIKGNVQIIKSSASNGHLLKGAVFGIFNIDDTLIEEITTDENGVAISKVLNYGEYYSKELSVPAGYILDDIHHLFWIEEDGKTIEINIQNQPVSGSIEIYYKHIKHCHEIADAYSYTDWVGIDYMS